MRQASHFSRECFNSSGLVRCSNLTGAVDDVRPCCCCSCCVVLLQVNLLDDHLVDVLLDSAASGWNTVEREGISISHPARFILVGSGTSRLAVNSSLVLGLRRPLQ